MILQLWSVRDLSVTLVSIEIHLNTGLLCIPFIFHAWTSCHIEIRLWIRREANTCPGLVLSGDTGQLSHVVRTLVRMQSLWNCQWCYSSFFCKTRNITFVIPLLSSFSPLLILSLILFHFQWFMVLRVKSCHTWLEWAECAAWREGNKGHKAVLSIHEENVHL